MTVPAIQVPPYKIVRSRRKSVGLYIRPQGVEVRAPHHVSQRDIHRWVSEKSAWIEQQLHQQALRASEAPHISHGEGLLFMGERRDIQIEPGNNQVNEDEGRLTIVSRQPEDESYNRAILEKWLKREAQLYIHERCLELAETMQVSEQVSAIKFRKTKTKWGHCTSTGILQFNWLIIMAPVEVIDYLLVHELSHLSHMNHSKQFWARVATFCPDHRALRQWLHHQGHKITL